MKQLKKRCSVPAILLAFIMIVLTICALLIQMNQNGKKKLEKLSRGFYSENIEKVMVDEVRNEDLEKAIKHSFSHCQDGLIFMTNLVIGQDLRGVCFKGNIEKPMIFRGRFFTERECFGVAPLALVGKKYESQINDGNKIYIEGIECRVLGILGDKEESRYDDMRLLNMSAALQIRGGGGAFVFDGKDAEEITNQASSFAEEMKGCTENVYYDHSEELGFDVEEQADTSEKNSLDTIYAAMILSFLLAMVCGTIFWCQKRKRKAQIECSLGAGRIYILLQLIREFCLIGLVSFLIGASLIKRIQFCWIPYDMYIEDFYKAALLVFVPGLVVVFLYGVFLINRYGQLKKIKIRFPLINLMLVGQFACFFWLFCQVITYYVNVNTESWVVNAKNGYQYYTLQENWDGEDIGEDPMSISNIKAAIKEVKKQPEFTYMATNLDSMGPVKKGTIKEHFGNKRLDDYLYLSLYPGYYKEHPETREQYESMLEGDTVSLSLCWMDENAINHYVKRAAKGRLFDKKDYNIRVDTKEVPIMLGNAYMDFFEVGDSFTLSLTKEVTAKVIGFLPKNTKFISDSTMEEKGYQVKNLDYKIIIPYFNIEGEAKNSEEKMFLQENYYNYLQGTLLFDDDVKQSVIMRAQSKVNEIYVSHSLYTVATANATIGVKMFLKETRQSVNIIMTLLLIMAVFGMISLCISLINKLNQNMERYGIELLNGKSIGKIVRDYVLEIVVLMGIAALITAYKMRYYIIENVQFAVMLSGILMMVFVPCIVIIFVKISRIDVEDLLCKTK